MRFVFIFDENIFDKKFTRLGKVKASLKIVKKVFFNESLKFYSDDRK